ncbi:MAG: CoA transferase [Armatimonadetes bacterium]|nr:CoA transferase [Armatimonadota bacterium]
MYPLDDLLVIDFTRALAGPYCSLMLGDMGARVIKVETPRGGDDTRGWAPPFFGPESAYFVSANRNKESITVDLKHPDGIRIIHELLARADVLVENFRPGVMDRLGLGYAAMHQRYPKLIYCSISGFGQDGPLREKVGYDLILQGMGGLMGVTGDEGGPPMKVGIPVADICAGMFGAYGVLAALHARARTGRGQWVDAALFDGQIAWMTHAASAFFATGNNPRRMGARHATIVPYQTFRTRDGHINVAVGSQHIWNRFAPLVVPELSADARFATNPDRVRNRDALLPILEARFLHRTTAEWASLLEEAAVPNGPIYRMSDIFADPQSIHREMKVTLPHATAGKVTVTGVPVKLSETPGAVRLAAPALGQHTEEILGELGYDAAGISRLRADGAI